MITPQLVAQISLFAQLPQEHLGPIAARAADIQLQPGEWLIHEGELPAFFGLLSGSLAVIKNLGGNEQVINRYGPGEYFGELPLLLGSTAVASLRALEPCRVLRLEPFDFDALVVGHPALSSELLRTMARRIGHLQQLALEKPAAVVRVISYRWDAACLDLRNFLARNQLAFEWLEPDDEAARPYLANYKADPVYPLVILQDQTILEAPSRREVAKRLGLQTSPTQPTYDVAIIGAGPAGLAAAVYGASEGLHTLLIDREAPGGQAGTSSRIENYLGFPAGLSGDELSQRALQQARRFGAEILVARTVTRLEAGLPYHRLTLDEEETVQVRAVVLATGVSWRRLNLPGLDQFVGRGVYYGAARTEGPLTQGKAVYLVGGGNSAGQAALFFANYARSVTLLVRGESLNATMSQYLIDQLTTKANIAVQTCCEVAEAQGEEHLSSLVLRDKQTLSEQTVPAEALFIFIGADAQTEWLDAAILRDEQGYILTGRDVLAQEAALSGWSLKRDPYLLETSVPGIFATGDVRHGSIKRVASGVGEGSMSIAFIHQYLSSLSAG